ncbi:helix-turn-helix domain-containing protein [Massilia endophytica]|uniref:helix-turn-helix domain-containing protein n=1 Tax=Massilia endophytica TaxID=2899220 RepID=UPI001E4EA519|nr:helix-turn-helix domain-containing protein [Massilia endophytica]UGQ48337.1 AraC family transcriptional regulator [Massilia endophytica]
MSVRHIIEKRRRLRRVLDYIEHHLSENITLAALADVACLSKFHFERFYAEALLETPLVTVRRLRLARAQALLHEGADVTSTALSCGYGSPQTFARAFHRSFGVTPSVMRQSAPLPRYQVGVAELPPRRVYRLPFADFEDPSATFDNLLARAENRGIARAAWTVWSQVDSGLDDVSSGACIERLNGVVPIGGACEGAIGGGRHLVVRWRGNDRPSPPELRRLAAAHTGLAPAPGRVLCHYVNDPVFTAPHERLADYYLPLK